MTRQNLLGSGSLTVVIGAITLCSLGTEVSATTVGSRVLVPASRQAAPKAGTPVKPSAKSEAEQRRAAARRRAAAAARALREAQEPKFKLDNTGTLVPDVRAEAAIAYDPVTGEVLWETNSQAQRSIASITKVMTAVVFLESAQNLSEQVVVQRADVRRASTTYLRAGYKLTTGDLLHLLLIGSDNAAARVLARVSRQGSEGFIARMNEKAAELGLASTRYTDPSGLLNDNVSSAYDMARLIAIASADERIGSIMQKARYSVVIGRQTVTVKSTNQLVTTGDVDVLGGKTGFIRRAGYCFAALLRLPQSGQQVAVVVLGAKSSAVRFWEARHLFNWLASKAEGFISTPLEAATTAIYQE
jgi:D-alanyl-D-alanine endopeptidase (penicillin-binding protein 7)